MNCPAKSFVVVALVLAGAVRAQVPDPRPLHGGGEAALRLRLGGAAARDVTLFPMSELLTRLAVITEDDPADPTDKDSTRGLRETILDAVGTFVEPAFENGEEAKWLGNEHLAVIGRPAQHEWVAGFLARAEAKADSFVLLEMELLRCSAALAAELAIGDVPRVLDAEAAATFSASLRSPGDAASPREGLDRLIAPRVLVRPLQSLQMSVGDPVSYVKDYELVKLENRVIADPVIEVLQTGFGFDGSLAYVGDESFALRCALRFAELERPIAERRIELGIEGAAPVTIQVPKLDEVTCEAQLRFSANETLVLPCPEFRGLRQFLVLRARRAPTGEDRR